MASVVAPSFHVPVWRASCVTSILSSRFSIGRRKNVELYANAKHAFSVSAKANAGTRQTAMVAIDSNLPSTSSGHRQSTSLLPIVAAAVGAIGLIAMALKKFQNKGLGNNMGRYNANMYLANAMKDVNTVRIEELSVEQIEAARARRSRERANHKLSLEDVELPQNHPFATKQKLSPEEQERALQNLRARSMRRRNYEPNQPGVDGGARPGPGALGRQR